MRPQWVTSNNAVKLLFFLFFLIATSQINAETLVIAQLSDRPKRDYKHLRPMLDLVVEQLRPYGIDRGEVILFKQREALINALKAGEVDWVTETLYSSALLVHEGGAEPLLQKWKTGQKEYRMLLFTRADSDIHSLEGLLGKTLSFEHMNSFSSYFLPRVILEEHGLKLHSLSSLREARQSDSVNFLFSRNEKNNVLWVHKGLVDVGVINDGDWFDSGRVPAHLRSELRVLHRSKPYPRALELVGPKVSANLKQALKRILLRMEANGHGDALMRYEGTTHFTEVESDLRSTLADIYQRSLLWSHQ